jgi:hypothetical protein
MVINVINAVTACANYKSKGSVRDTKREKIDRALFGSFTFYGGANDSTGSGFFTPVMPIYIYIRIEGCSINKLIKLFLYNLEDVKHKFYF